MYSSFLVYGMIVCIRGRPAIAKVHHRKGPPTLELGIGLGLGLGLMRTFAIAVLCDGGPEPCITGVYVIVLQSIGVYAGAYDCLSLQVCMYV